MDLSVDIYLTSAFRELDAFSIPGIGTFRKVYKKARLDEENSQILPPTIEIAFNTIVEPALLLNTYFTDYLNISPNKAEQIIFDIRTAILSSLEEIGYFEVPAIGTLEKTAGQRFEFFMFNAQENALADDFFGLKPVRFAQNTDITLHQSENPTFMNNDKNPERSVLFSSVGWRTFLLIALIFALGFLLVDQGPFVIHRSSIDSGMLQVRALQPPRSFSNDDFFSDENTSTEDSINTEDEFIASATIPEETDPETKDGNPRTVVENPDTPEPILVDGPKVEKEDEPETLGTKDELIASSQTNPTHREGGTRGGEQTTRSLNVLDTAKNQEKIIKPNTHVFHLIAGSFISLNSAENFKAEFLEKNKNLDAIILLPAAGTSQTYRVSIYQNSDKARVESFNEKLNKLGKKSGWIYEYKGN